MGCQVCCYPNIALPKPGILQFRDMLPRSNTLRTLARSAANFLHSVVWLFLISLLPGLVAQQYCVSGAVTSVGNCNSCNFHVGDTMAMTFTVAPGDATCTAMLSCTAHSSFSANIGGRNWTEPNPNTSGNLVTISSAPFGTSTTISISGDGNLSPLPNPEPSDFNLIASLTIAGIPGNLVSGGALPATLPSPATVTSSHAFLTFAATTVAGGGAPAFSYTGQNCASSGSSPTVTAIVDGATFASTTGAPSTYMSIFGANLANTSTDWGSAFVNGNAPTSLGGASVTVNGTPAYIAYASPGQLNIVTPAISATGSGIPVVVTLGAQQSVAFNITLQSTAPYLFFWPLASPNNTKYLVAQHANPTSDVGNMGLFPNNSPAATPAKPGETIVLYGTGFGATTPMVTPGTLTTVANNLVTLPTATVGGIPATVQFAGLANGFCELYQIDLTIPPSSPNGDQAVVLTVNGVPSVAGLITVQQ